MSDNQSTNRHEMIIGLVTGLITDIHLGIHMFNSRSWSFLTGGAEHTSTDAVYDAIMYSAPFIISVLIQIIYGLAKGKREQLDSRRTLVGIASGIGYYGLGIVLFAVVLCLIGIVLSAVFGS